MNYASEKTVEQYLKALIEQKTSVILELYMQQNIFQKLRKKKKAQSNKKRGSSLSAVLHYKRCLRQFFRQNMITD